MESIERSWYTQQRYFCGRHGAEYLEAKESITAETQKRMWSGLKMDSKDL